MRARERFPPRISAGVPDASREAAQASALAVVVHGHSADVLLIPSQLPTVEVLRRPFEFTQYTSYEYTERLKRAGIAPSRGRTGTALDNAMAESIMSTLKRELTKRYTWRTRLDLELALVSYIGWYNARRKHLSLTVVENGRIRRLSPLQVLDRYNQEVAMLAVASK